MPAHPVCRAYPTARAAYDAIRAAGFVAGGPIVLAPPAPTHDRRTVVRFHHRNGWAFGQVTLARRR